MSKNEAIATIEGSSAATNHRPSQDEIAARAHEIFLERGGVAGHDVDDWLQAEMELSSKRTNGMPGRIRSVS